MAYPPVQRKWVVPIILLVILGSNASFAGVSRAIQDRYRRNYENKALFLKLPIYSDRQYIFIVGRSARPEQAPGGAAARFKVGDQVRVLSLDFGGDEIKFRVGAITGAGFADLIYKFESDLSDDFSNSDAFDVALGLTFTEGLKHSDLEDARRGYVEDQFERAVREIAATGGTTRESVLKNLAARLPAHQDALRDIENLKGRNHELSGQLTQAQSENRRLDSELKQQHNEVARLRNATTTLQEKADSSSTQLSRLGDDLRNARGAAQNLQRSLNLKIDTNRDLASQIGDLGQTIRKQQKDHESLESQNSSLRSNLEEQQSLNSRLSGEVEDLNTANRRMRETIETLTSKEDSLARQYLDLKKVKEQLEEVTLSVENLNSQVVEDKTQDGNHYRKIQVSLRNIPLGFIEWQLPEHVSHNELREGEVKFSTESIDYVRVAPEERHILRSLGERLKLAVKLVSQTAAIEIKPEKGEPVQEVGERDQASWRWKILNRGTDDTRLVLSVHLVNRNADEIPLLKEEHAVLSSSVVRQVRNYLQPIPMAIGALLGFLLFGIVGIFRRAKKSDSISKKPAVSPSEPPYIRQKQL